MALVTAYLARTAQQKAGRTTVSATRNVFDRVTGLIRVTRQALTEAQELRRAMTQKYPFMDI